MTLIVDASVVVASLIDQGEAGTWALEQLGSDDLAAPQLLPVEAGDALRGAALRELISQDSASLAHASLQELRIDLLPYGPVADRVWELRHNLRLYDAWYVALAEWMDAPLLTLDRRLARAPGVECRVVLPPE